MSGLDDLRDYAEDWPGLRRAVDAVEAELRAAQAAADERYHAWEWVEAHGGLKLVQLHFSEGARFGRIVDEAAGRLGISTEGLGSQDAKERLMAALDHRLMPEGHEWPRDARGVPIVRGETVWANGTCHGDGRAWHVRRVCPGSGYPVEAEDAKGDKRDLKAHWVTHERPAKVLDADGVEIRVGDTVYATVENSYGEKLDIGGSLTVKSPGSFVAVTDGKGRSMHVFREHLTHRAPVLAADGKPLREGEMVWISDEGYKRRELVKGEPLKVLAINDEGVVSVLDQYDIAKGSNFPWRFAPSDLTHERPDSWERLEEDAAERTCEYFGQNSYSTLCDGCPQEGMIQKEDCRAAKARDLVRRAKKLAGVE